MDVDLVIGKLVRFWSWAHQQADKRGHIAGVTCDTIDALIAAPNFASALQSVKWLRLQGDGVILPNFTRWFSQTTKSRMLKSKRQARWRAKKSVYRVDAVDALEERRGEERISAIPAAALSAGGDARGGAQCTPDNRDIRAALTDAGIGEPMHTAMTEKLAGMAGATAAIRRQIERGKGPGAIVNNMRAWARREAKRGTTR